MYLKNNYLFISSALIATLITGITLTYDGTASLTGISYSSPANFLADLIPNFQLNGLLLLAFLSGIVSSTLLITRPMRAAYRAREAQLQANQTQLEALNRELHRQATSDGLLGIANRREFERVLDLEWRRADRERQPLSLLMIDVDCFKLYNDTYGHLKGDDCLQKVAAALQSVVCRPGDLVARYGGEEMVVLLPKTGLEGASQMAQRIHSTLAECSIPFPDSSIARHVTVSIGAASMLPSSSISAHVLIAHADDGLYAAKDNGRNRTEVVPRLRLIASADDPTPLPPQAQGIS